ncbi:MAG: alpha/beta hydrolase, partial [Leptospira sp.]|nr:alpha/beta hydrolase [Leptospira sp.]
MKNTLAFYLAVLLVFGNCNLIPENSHDKSKKKKDILNLLYLYIQSQSNHQLYRYIPNLVQTGTTSSSSQFIVANQSVKSEKTKVIFIHGWDFTERSSDPATSNDKKITNINGTWSAALEFYNKNVSSVYSNYDLYVFTYRTSDSISLNGSRFIETLNSNFTKSDRIVIVAHSMGGLVTRYAIYSDKNYSDIIDYVITLGTPHYGSPFSSAAYQQNSAVLGDLISFMTNTDGGKSLAYTNNGNGQINISGAQNTELDSLNTKTNKDQVFYAYAGDLSTIGCSNAPNGLIYSSGCAILRDGNPQFSQ